MGNGPIDPESITDPNLLNHPVADGRDHHRMVLKVSYTILEFWEELNPFLTVDQWQALDRLSRQEETNLRYSPLRVGDFTVSAKLPVLGLGNMGLPIPWFTSRRAISSS